MRLVNREEVIRVWFEMLAYRGLVLIAIRHGRKSKNRDRRGKWRDPRRGMSPEGFRQVKAYRQPLRPFLLELASRRMLPASTNTVRTYQTVYYLLINVIPNVEVLRTPGIDLPFKGPNNEDQATGTRIFHEHGRELGLEKYEQAQSVDFEEVAARFGKDYKRVGERPEVSKKRIRDSLLGLTWVARAGSPTAVVLYSFNWPDCSDPLGITQPHVGELETFFFGLGDDGGFKLLGHVCPKFAPSLPSKKERRRRRKKRPAGKRKPARKRKR